MGVLLSDASSLSPHSLGYDQLTDAGVQAIAQALASHPTLKTLEYDLAHPLSLPPAHSFSTISLGFNKTITDASCPALANLLPTILTLELLE